MLNQEVQRALAKRQKGYGRALLLSPDDYRSLFASTTKKIVKLVEKHLGQDGIGKVDYLFLVGGFGESKLLYRRLVERFEGAEAGKVLNPPWAGAAVLRGAASYGLDPSIIRARRAKKTYGVDCYQVFEREFDPPSRRFEHPDGTARCKDRFSIWVSRGEKVEVDEPRETIYYPIFPDQTTVNFDLYCTNKAKPRYVDERDIWKVGEVTVPMPDTTGGVKRPILVKMLFGRTTLTAKFLDKTSGTERELSINFEGTYFPLKDEGKGAAG